jgi:hypothetical protein
MALLSNQACPLTGQVAEITDDEFDGWTVIGHYTNGSYRIAGSILEQVRRLNPENRAKIITWIVDQHRFGDPNPLLTSNTVDAALQRRKMTYDYRVQRFFEMLKFSDFSLGQSLRFAGAMDDAFFRRVGQTWAWLEIAHEGELAQILKAMTDEQLLREENFQFYLTANGLRRLDELSQMATDSDQVFVAMWFSDEMDDAYTNGFQLGINDNGFRALRIDQKEHSNKIDDEIIAEIRRSRFIVADFTCQLANVDQKNVAIARGGVYYEAGFAQGIGIPVIWTVRSDCIDHVHFDTRQYAHIVWDTPLDLREKLKNRIGAVIGIANKL